MARILTTPATMAVYLLAACWCAAALTLGADTSHRLNRCEAAGSPTEECRLLLLGR